MDSIDNHGNRFSLFSLSSKEVEIRFMRPVHMEVPMEIMEFVDGNNNVTKDKELKDEC